MDDPTVETVDLGADLYSIDTRMSGYAGITSAYLLRGSRPCLVETGTATSAPVVRDSLAELGVGADDLATIVVTHIHLDHAGGVGTLAGMFPRADVVVHERGARHLVDPERLMTSARRVFGRVLDDVFGVLEPTEASRVRTLGDTGHGRPRRRTHARRLLRPRPRPAPCRTCRLRHRGPVRRRRRRRVHPGDGRHAPVDTAAGLRPRPGTRHPEPFHGGRPAQAPLQPLRAGRGRVRRRWAAPRRSYGSGSSWSGTPGPTPWTSTMPCSA